MQSRVSVCPDSLDGGELPGGFRPLTYRASLDRLLAQRQSNVMVPLKINSFICHRAIGDGCKDQVTQEGHSSQLPTPSPSPNSIRMRHHRVELRLRAVAGAHVPAPAGASRTFSAAWREESIRFRVFLLAPDFSRICR